MLEMLLRQRNDELRSFEETTAEKYATNHRKVHKDGILKKFRI